MSQKVEPAAGSAISDYDERRRSRRSGRRVGLPLLLALFVAALVGAVIWLLSERSTSGGSDAPEAATPVETTTAAVERRTLVETERLDGTLEFAEVAPLAAQRPGTVTRLAPEASSVGRGTELYRLDDEPVVVLTGTLPAFRPMERGIPEGPDVFQLERNLIELGYDPDGKIDLDSKFNKSTEAAVKRWEEDIGATKDGVVGLGDVVFLVGERRVGQHRAKIAEVVQPGSPVLELTAPSQVIKVDLEADRQDLVAVGDTLEIELPSNDRIAGVVSEIGRVANSQVLPDGTRLDPTIDVTILPTDPIGEDLDQAPVKVFVTKRAADDVLAAPVAALVALRGGGYAVEVMDGTTTRLVAVEPGLFADGLVELSGEISEGTVVVVPK